MEVMGQLLAAHTLLSRLSGSRQLAEYAAHALRVLPGATATAARLDGEVVLDGAWNQELWERSCARLETEDAYQWQSLGDEQVLLLSVATVGHRHGCLYVLGSRPEAIEPYLPFLSNFAAGLALTLENQHQRAQIEAANERQRASQAEYKQLFSTMTSGFALHEILTDEHGQPTDYRFLEANAAFEELTGLRREKIIGHTALEVLPGLEHSWVETYGRVALAGARIEFEDYSASLGRHYHVLAYSPSQGRFATLFTDITERKAAEQDRQRLIDQLQLQSEQLQLLFEEQRRIATTLQANFLHPLPEVAGWEFGLASQPASANDLIGGDFHDLFALPDDYLAVLLGDVEGKGITAAGMTETVHVAARALSIFSPLPSDVLERLNRLLLLQESELVTALFAVVHRRSGLLSIGSAGHPAPLLLHRDGRAEQIKVIPGLPLGAVEESAYQMSTAQLEPGDSLLLYTDGVIDARRQGVFFAEEGLLGACQKMPRASAGEMAEGLRRAVTEFADELRDDVHILVVRRALGGQA
jgi:PAS domain S-box-containing protein